MYNRNNEIRRYEALNSSYAAGCAVILGSDEELMLPVSEMRERWSVKQSIVNRSFPRLSVTEAAGLYRNAVSALKPSKVIVRVGNEDTELFMNDRAAFDRAFMQLIAEIRRDNAKCDIVLVSADDARVSGHISGIASSCGCGYVNAEAARVCDMNAVMDVMTMGFVRPVKKEMSAELLAKALYSFENAIEAKAEAKAAAPVKHWYTGLFRFAGAQG